jgi:hypothetical protein
MAQTAKTTRKKAANANNGAGTGASGSSNSGSAKRSTSQRSRANGSRANQTSSTRARPKSRSTRSTQQAKAGSASITDAAVEKTKAARHAISEVASRAKTPLIAGGTALAGAVAGAVVRDRLANNRSKGPLDRLRGVPIPKPSANLNLGNLDLEKVKSTADRVSAYGQQASDIASAVEKTRKKNQ